MAFKCGFFNAINSDRKYNADDMMNPIKGIVGEGVIADDKKSNGLQVQAVGGLDLIVKRGRGIFFGKWCENDSDMSFTVPMPAVTETRIDSIVIRIDISDDVRNGFIEYKQGGATAPSLENSTMVKEYRLANIIVVPNAQEITQSSIEDTRPTSECGFVSNLLQNSDITATYEQWQAQFEEWFNSHKTAANEQFAEQENRFDEKINNDNALMEEKHSDFDEWFGNIKETVSTTTLIRSFSSKYTTTEQDETIIPINISRYNSVIDILQVYISGLLCIEGFDYVVKNFNEIELANGVDAGTEVSFIVYKSVDGSEAESVVAEIEQIDEDINDINSNIDDLQTRVETLEEKNVNALWTGADTMGDGVTIIPSKKLSECKNGWILVFSAYDSTTGDASYSRVGTYVIPKGLLSLKSNIDVTIPLIHALGASGEIETAGKRVYVSDSQISGYAGNTAGNYNGNIALCAVYAF